MEESVFVPVSDSVQLEARIYNPSTSLAGSPAPRGLAIVAHPYGSLGGCFDDHVVCALAEVLLVKRQFQVVTFNSRGVGQSTGRASWTGASESDDYQHVLDWSMCNFEEQHSSVRGASIVLCGYSAGSLYCSTSKAKASGSPSTWSTRPPLYVLVSYPRGVLWVLSLFQSARYNKALNNLLVEGQAGVLLVYGTKDDFTSRKTYESWIGPLQSSQLSVEAIEDADHFWRTRASLKKLVDCVEGADLPQAAQGLSKVEVAEVTALLQLLATVEISLARSLSFFTLAIPSPSIGQA
ncbi:hypothetical protein A4X09_0g4251 [Tilletia walkeri]|uniref:Xaa-Pro dipeptidyl-peptidase-like domain-containing protein n=1 Tax=Tilletia walkeri TaxID=117179 RepID=A0A8X7T416_9BASI|nr:hypothetical protein A4X09_0g4251 [Tilletia walkeri]